MIAFNAVAALWLRKGTSMNGKVLSGLSSSFENINLNEEDKLKKLEHDWAVAMSKGDTATLSTLLAKESITVFADTALPTHFTMGYAIDSHTKRAKKNITFPA